jgi:hypothetical protein
MYKSRISELEYALRQEMLKNEETQATNYALKQIIEEFQSSKRRQNDNNISGSNIKISTVVTKSNNNELGNGANFSSRVINSEKEMELKIELLNLSEKLEN